MAIEGKHWDSNLGKYVDDDIFDSIIRIKTKSSEDDESSEQNSGISINLGRNYKSIQQSSYTTNKTKQTSQSFSSSYDKTYGDISERKNQIVLKTASKQNNYAGICNTVNYIGGFNNDKNDEVTLTYLNGSGDNAIVEQDIELRRNLCQSFSNEFIEAPATKDDAEQEDKPFNYTTHQIFSANAFTTDLQGNRVSQKEVASKMKDVLIETIKEIPELQNRKILIAEHAEQRNDKNNANKKSPGAHLHIIYANKDNNGKNNGYQSEALQIKIKQTMTKKLREMGLNFDEPTIAKKAKYIDREPNLIKEVIDIVHFNGKIKELHLKSENGIESRICGIDLDRLVAENNIEVGDKIKIKTTKEEIEKGKHKNHFELVYFKKRDEQIKESKIKEKEPQNNFSDKGAVKERIISSGFDKTIERYSPTYKNIDEQQEINAKPDIQDDGYENTIRQQEIDAIEAHYKRLRDEESAAERISPQHKELFVHSRSYSNNNLSIDIAKELLNTQDKLDKKLYEKDQEIKKYRGFKNEIKNLFSRDRRIKYDNLIREYNEAAYNKDKIENYKKLFIDSNRRDVYADSLEFGIYQCKNFKEGEIDKKIFNALKNVDVTTFLALDKQYVDRYNKELQEIIEANGGSDNFKDRDGKTIKTLSRARGLSNFLQMNKKAQQKAEIEKRHQANLERVYEKLQGRTSNIQSGIKKQDLSR